MWYRCPHSNQYYGIVYEQERYCDRTDFDMACPGDTHFYQACGHGGCAGYEVGDIKKLSFSSKNSVNFHSNKEIIVDDTRTRRLKEID